LKCDFDNENLKKSPKHTYLKIEIKPHQASGCLLTHLYCIL